MPALALAALGFLVWCGVMHHATERQRRERAALVARADQQHPWVLAGEDRGTYGAYPPNQSIELVQSQYRAPDF